MLRRNAIQFAEWGSRTLICVLSPKRRVCDVYDPKVFVTFNMELAVTVAGSS